MHLTTWAPFFWFLLICTIVTSTDLQPAEDSSLQLSPQTDDSDTNKGHHSSDAFSPKGHHSFNPFSLRAASTQMSGGRPGAEWNKDHQHRKDAKIQIPISLKKNTDASEPSFETGRERRNRVQRETRTKQTKNRNASIQNSSALNMYSDIPELSLDTFRDRRNPLRRIKRIKRRSKRRQARDEEDDDDSSILLAPGGDDLAFSEADLERTRELRQFFNEHLPKLKKQTQREQDRQQDLFEGIPGNPNINQKDEEEDNVATDDADDNNPDDPTLSKAYLKSEMSRLAQEIGTEFEQEEEKQADATMDMLMDHGNDFSEDFLKHLHSMDGTTSNRENKKKTPDHDVEDNNMTPHSNTGKMTSPGKTIKLTSNYEDDAELATPKSQSGQVPSDNEPVADFMTSNSKVPHSGATSENTAPDRMTPHNEDAADTTAHKRKRPNGGKPKQAYRKPEPAFLAKQKSSDEADSLSEETHYEKLQDTMKNKETSLQKSTENQQRKADLQKLKDITDSPDSKSHGKTVESQTFKNDKKLKKLKNEKVHQNYDKVSQKEQSKTGSKQHDQNIQELLSLLTGTDFYNKITKAGNKAAKKLPTHQGQQSGSRASKHGNGTAGLISFSPTASSTHLKPGPQLWPRLRMNGGNFSQTSGKHIANTSSTVLNSAPNASHLKRATTTSSDDTSHPPISPAGKLQNTGNRYDHQKLSATQTPRKHGHKQGITTQSSKGTNFSHHMKKLDRANATELTRHVHVTMTLHPDVMNSSVYNVTTLASQPVYNADEGEIYLLVPFLASLVMLCAFLCFLCCCTGGGRWLRRRNSVLGDLDKKLSGLKTKKPFYQRLGKFRKAKATESLKKSSKFTVDDHFTDSSEEEVFDVSKIKDVDSKGPLSKVPWSKQVTPY